ncbi:hypothetical protein OCL06_02860 [Alteromonas sp. ASW11-19]|uniref:Uncharacterized protein n=1 Tax=Alteromonas salexigens TaxID=2982530 RepID=A0ABT2VJV6_9ALTE|nr:hypothetical protein [Alteromonas salexigens]MCU7553537.1 hypothetical protein [Alteromonas salexigens]
MSKPTQRWQGFLLGLAVFALGAALLLILGDRSRGWYWLSLAVLFGGFAIAMRCYISLFLSRFDFLRHAKKISRRYDSDE